MHTFSLYFLLSLSLGLVSPSSWGGPFCFPQRLQHLGAQTLLHPQALPDLTLPPDSFFLSIRCVRAQTRAGVQRCLGTVPPQKEHIQLGQGQDMCDQ